MNVLRQVEPDQVVWEDGRARPAGANVGDFEPMTVAELAKEASWFGGTIAGHAEINVAQGGPGFGTHVVDVEVDRRTGAVKILRYTLIQDAGKAVYPEFIEGQFQGGAVQGIGTALNEEYIYNDKGVLENPGFLDYRVPVASDVPFINTEIVEVPNPDHPYGIRGIGEVPIIPPLPAIANAIHDAVGVRLRDHPMSPPKVLKALKDQMIEDAAALTGVSRMAIIASAMKTTAGWRLAVESVFAGALWCVGRCVSAVFFVTGITAVRNAWGRFIYRLNRDIDDEERTPARVGSVF